MASHQFKEIAVSALKLDLFNPRLPKSKQGKDEKTVIEYMLLEAATLELMLAIGENDFFAGEMLLVIVDTNDPEKYIVIEGNRRLTAVKLLLNPSLTSVKKVSTIEIVDGAKFKPTVLPCLVFSDKSKILKYLGFRHITGIKSWRLLEKARYLKNLSENEDFLDLTFLEKCKEIAKMIGSTGAYVKKLLISFDMYKIVEDEAFYQINGLNDTRFFLNYFTDSLNKENIRNFLNVDLDTNLPIEHLNRPNLEKLTQWWFEKDEGQSRVLGDSEGLKLLDSVIGHQVALEAFENGASIYNAYEMTRDYDTQFESSIRKVLKAVEKSHMLSPKVTAYYPNFNKDIETAQHTLKLIEAGYNLKRN